MGNAEGAVVECYSGHAYAEEPRAFCLAGVRHVVTRIQRRWREPRGPVFEITADDGLLYVLGYDETREYWQVHRMNRQRQNSTSEDDQR